MPDLPNPFQTLRSIKHGHYFSLPVLAEQGLPSIHRLPLSIRIVLESLLRNCDGRRVKEEDVIRLANWNAKHPYEGDVPFIVSRVILQDFTGVPVAGGPRCDARCRRSLKRRIPIRSNQRFLSILSLTILCKSIAQGRRVLMTAI